jgi:hypothetical protein
MIRDRGAVRVAVRVANELNLNTRAKFLGAWLEGLGVDDVLLSKTTPRQVLTAIGAYIYRVA